MTLKQQILVSIRTLPIQQQHEVLNFAQFLCQKSAPKPLKPIGHLDAIEGAIVTSQ